MPTRIIDDPFLVPQLCTFSQILVLFTEHDYANQVAISNEKLSSLWYDFKACKFCGHEKVENI